MCILYKGYCIVRCGDLRHGCVFHCR